MPATLSFLLTLAMAAGAAAGPLPRVTPLTQENDGRLVIPVRINGQGPFRFRIDTGASRSVVSNQLARRLTLRSAGQTLLVTPTGRTHHSLVLLAGVVAGCIRPASVVAVAVADRDVDPAGRVDGLLGQDVLASRAFTLDYARSELQCHEPGAPLPDGIRLPLSMGQGRALVAVPHGARGLLLVADSGTDRLVLFTRADRATPAATPLDTLLLDAIGGRRLARRVLVHGLGFAAPGTDRAWEGVLLDDDPGDGLMGDGLLPLHVFARVTFNAPEGVLIVGTSG